MSEMSDMHKLIMAMKLAKTEHVGLGLTYFDVIELLGELDSLKFYIAELEAVNKVLKDEHEALRKEHERMYRLFWSGSTLPEPPVDQLTAHDAIERQDDKWIPVSERLPDNWMSVLTIDRSKSTRDMMTAFYNPETSLWSTHFSCDLWVTHWMPLPEPPIMYGKEREE